MMIDRGISAHIQVDGGIGTQNIKEVYEAGANCFVAGSSVYGKPDPIQAIRDLKKACEG